MPVLTNPEIVAGVIGALGTVLAAVAGAAIQAVATVRASRARKEVPEASPAGSGRPPARLVRPWRVRLRLWLYVIAVGLAGLVVLAGFYRDLQREPAPTTWGKLVELCTASIQWNDEPGLLLLVWFVAMLAFSLLPRALPQGGSKTSVSSVYDFSAILLFGPAGAAVIAGVTNLLSNLRRGFVRPAFNFFQVVLTVSASAAVYRYFGGQFGEGVRVDSVPAAVAVGMAAFVYFLVNSLLVAGALALDQRISLRHAWRRNFERQAPEVFLFLLPVGTVLALAQVRFGFPGFALVLPFVIQMHRAYAGRLTSADTRMGVLRTIASEIDRADERTADHSLRIASYAVRVAWEMGASAKEAEEVEAAALLHNVGTLAMRRLLTKEAHLTPLEQRLMERHPEICHDVLKTVPGLEGVARILYWHQERPDGKGYPRGLARGIPLGARILAVVDAFDAMVNPRPYPRPRMTADAAYKELRAGAGTQFDPHVVGAVIRLHREGRLDEELGRVLEDMPRRRAPSADDVLSRMAGRRTRRRGDRPGRPEPASEGEAGRRETGSPEERRRPS
jgi:HD-GYP domain-containing protein (c-di-GMP phosphodiesterase class II)